MGFESCNALCLFYNSAQRNLNDKWPERGLRLLAKRPSVAAAVWLNVCHVCKEARVCFSGGVRKPILVSDQSASLRFS